MSEDIQENAPEQIQVEAQKKPNAISSAISDFVSRLGILGELMQFLWARKLWWMMPMFIALGLFVFLIIVAEVSGSAPFIYTLW